MEWVLQRSYYKSGTNGALFVNEKLVCFTIELPWKDNERRMSCIPEGRYRIEARISKKFGTHLYVADVLQRSLILIHPANNALNELAGCIAPVCDLTGIGNGLYSRRALEKLLLLHSSATAAHTPVYLTINYNAHEFSRTLSETHSAVFQKPEK